MRLDSRFNLNQTVWNIRNSGQDKFSECPSCTGGQIILPDKRTLPCPRCKERGLIATRFIHRWSIGERLTIGQIRLQVGGGREDDEERYMAYETGVGSGSLHSATDLFPTQEEAQVECDKRNREPGKVWVCTTCNPEHEAYKYSAFHEWRHCSIHGNNNHLDLEKSLPLIEKWKAQRKELEEGS